MRLDQRTSPARRTVALFATALALATVTAAAAHNQAGADARSWQGAKREPYPPARLWYRVTVEFSGEQLNPHSAGSQLGESKRMAAWTLRSDHAIRLMLLCHNIRKPSSQPFSVRRKIRGRLVTVGGCADPVHDGLRPTLRFAARASGDWRSYEYIQEARSIPGCSPGDLWRREQLVSSQRLVGAISTQDSAGEGLSLGASPTPPFGTFLSQRWDCLGRLAQGEDQLDGNGWLFGTEEGLANPKAKRRWVPLRQHLTFRIPTSRFGKSFDVKLGARQFPQPSGYPFPPPELGGSAADALLEKRYRYTIRFEPCPRGGLDVRSC